MNCLKPSLSKSKQRYSIMSAKMKFTPFCYQRMMQRNEEGRYTNVMGQVGNMKNLIISYEEENARVYADKA